MLRMKTEIRLLAAALCAAVCLAGCGRELPAAENAPVTTAPAVTTVSALTTSPEITGTTTTVTVDPVWEEHVTETGENGHIIEDVPHYTQFDKYLTACESLAGVSVLRYYGIDITPDLFLSGYLPVADFPGTGEDGKMYGESPWLYFIGDPLQMDGFGCYSGALVRGINKIRSGLAKPLRGQPLDKLCAKYIDKGQPVIIWATMYMDYPQESMQWYLPDGTLFTFMAPEHALVLIGYDDWYYYFSDSLQYENVVAYGREVTGRAYNGLEMQAVVIDPNVLASVPEFWRIQPEAEASDSAEETESGNEYMLYG